MRDPGLKSGGKGSPVTHRWVPLKTWSYMVGVLLILFSLSLLPPIAVAWYYDGYGVMPPCAETFAASLGLGLLCWLPDPRFKIDLRNRDGFILVVAFWVLSSLLGALPFVLSDQPQMRFVDAVFETVSGLTTTATGLVTGGDPSHESWPSFVLLLLLLGGCVGLTSGGIKAIRFLLVRQRRV